MLYNMTKDEVLKLIKEYQDYPKYTDYPVGRELINQDDLEVHEQVAESLREELDKNPDFFKQLDDVGVKSHINKKHNEKVVHKSEKNGDNNK